MSMIGGIFQGIGMSIQGIGQMVMAHANVNVAKKAKEASAAHDAAVLEQMKWAEVELKTDLFSRVDPSTSVYMALAVIAFVIVVIVIFTSLTGSTKTTVPQT